MRTPTLFFHLTGAPAGGGGKRTLVAGLCMIAFSCGVSEPDEPAIAVRDPTGAITTWIDIGTPDARRLHKASKAARRVVVYTHKDPRQFLNQLAGERIHRAEALELYAIDRELVAALVARLERRVAFSMSVAEGELYVSIATENLTGNVVRLKRDTDHST
jgi:uncharacterized protein YaeQ